LQLAWRVRALSPRQASSVGEAWHRHGIGFVHQSSSYCFHRLANGVLCDAAPDAIFISS
jgi:hypothetical protein